MNQNINLATEPETRQTEIEREFSRVTEIAAYIDKMTGELESALSRSILAQRNEAKASGGAGTSEPVRVPLAQSLYEHGTALEGVRERLSSILSRLEA